MKQNLCESNSLVAFLDGRLSGQQERDLILHLDDCSECAEKLEQLAADTSRWQNVKSHLSRSRTVATLPPENKSDADALPLTIRQTLGMLDPTDDPNSMGRIGGFEVIGVVGSGAMGVVLKAFDQTLDRVVALKVMNSTLAACGTARHRFAREAKAAAGVLHPNVVAIHGVSTERELPFLVMPYIAGMSLQQRMDREGPLKLIDILRIGSQLAAGLAAAHQKGLIHRDIKPSNVMLDEGVETALITDFGLARTIDDATMTRSGAITGTPEFMSPEQARGDTVDCASDVFSLGSVLYALCTGDRPFRAKTSFGVLRKITDQQPVSIREINPDVPLWLCHLIERMHSKQSSERPSSAEVRDLLERCLAHVYQPDRIALPQELSQPKANRTVFLTRALITGAFLIMTLIFISILAVAMLPGPTPPEGDFQPVASSVIDDSFDKATVFKKWDLMFPKQGKRGLLIVDVQRGRVEVTGHDQPGVVIEVLTPPEFEKPDKGENGFTKIFTPKYDLDTDPEKNSIKLDAYNQDYPLNLRIKVPRKTNLSLDSYIDGLFVKNVAGTIKTHTQHGTIKLLDIEGTATAYSRNGSLTIRFRRVAPEGVMDFESYNGNIDLSLPGSIATTTAISSGTGSYRSMFTIDPIEKSERPRSIVEKVKRNIREYQFGKINGGGIPLRIECEKGDIVLRKTKTSADR